MSDLIERLRSEAEVLIPRKDIPGCSEIGSIMSQAADTLARQAAVIARVEALADSFDTSAAQWSERVGDVNSYEQGRCNSFCEAEAQLRYALKGNSNDHQH